MTVSVFVEGEGVIRFTLRPLLLLNGGTVFDLARSVSSHPSCRLQALTVNTTPLYTPSPARKTAINTHSH